MPLRQCFLPTRLLPDIQTLLAQLQLPILDLPLPAASSLTFLDRLGVSTELNLPMLLKALQHLSAARQLAGSDSDLAAMQRLYELVHAQALQDPDAAAEVRRHFEQQPLVFVRAGQPEAWQGFWLACTDVMWSGSRRIFPHKTFIAAMYMVSGPQAWQGPDTQGTPRVPARRAWPQPIARCSNQLAGVGANLLCTIVRAQHVLPLLAAAGLGALLLQAAGGQEHQRG